MPRTVVMRAGFDAAERLDAYPFQNKRNGGLEWVYEGLVFTFVTDGVQNVIAQAQAVAGDKTVAVASPTLVQQCINAGLLDEIHIDLVPVWSRS